MSNLHIQGELPPGTAIRIGCPADEPTEALYALQQHFQNRPKVHTARLGLMEQVRSEPGDFFTYTIGITCDSPENRQAEELAAMEVLKNVPLGRWPIAFFPPISNFFTKEAKVFYRRPSSPGWFSFVKRAFR